MYWLTMTLVFLIVGSRVLKWDRLRQLLPAAFVGMLLSGIPSAPALGVRLTDVGPISSHWAITLILQMTVAPVVSMWYAQGLTPSSPVPLGRTAAFLGMTYAMTLVSWATGRLILPNWWYLLYLLVHQLICCLCVAAVQHTGAKQTDRASR